MSTNNTPQRQRCCKVRIKLCILVFAQLELVSWKLNNTYDSCFEKEKDTRLLFCALQFYLTATSFVDFIFD